MTYREAIKKSLDKVKTDKFSGRCGHTYIEVIPNHFSCFLLSVSVVAAYYSFNRTFDTELNSFIKLISGTHEDQESVTAVRSRMERFVIWLLDEEIPENNNWYDIETIKKNMYQFLMKG